MKPGPEGCRLRDLSRLLRPGSVAVIGGGAWCASVRAQLDKAGFAGPVWQVHPTEGDAARVADLPAAPDAAFVGINRDATLAAVADLSAMGAGGAVCFASGFAEVADGAARHAALLDAAGPMPVLGPNCYGFINALDGALLWPDQHGCLPVDRGVAILTQSSNIAINLTMQGRALPMAYMVTCGNQAQTSQAEIAMALLDDPRVSAIGLHVEGFGDLAAWQRFARAARARGVPVVLLKVGRSDQARAATVSHTASLAGGDAGAQALCDRFGFARVADLETLLEALKVLHMAGPLPRGTLASISCSGGEASLAADLALETGLRFPPLNDRQLADLSEVLGPRVTLANPLDYHTYIWRDTDAMTRAFAAMVDPGLDLTVLIVDFPRRDRCDAADWDSAINAAIGARARTGGAIAMCATLPELMPEDVAQGLAAAGVIPLMGLRTALAAIAAARRRDAPDLDLDLPATAPARPGRLLSEATAKAALAAHGLRIPANAELREVSDRALAHLRFPVVLKALGHAHKTEAGAVVLNLPDIAAVEAAADTLPPGDLLVEEMVTGAVVELLIGVTRDPAHGLMLTLGAGGTLAELAGDSVSLMLPASPERIEAALRRLRLFPRIAGYRGAAGASLPAILRAVTALQDYALANAATLQEVEVNPLICTPDTAIAADALIRIADD